MVSLLLAALVASDTALDGSAMPMGSVAYSLMRNISTPGFNHVTARDPSELEKLPEETRAWVGRWLDWSYAEHLALRNTRPMPALDGVRAAHGNSLQMVNLEGAASFLDDSSRGFLFLFNPSARRVCQKITFDEGAAVPSTSGDATFLAHEIHPREEVDGLQTPVGVWKHGEKIDICVAPQSARVIRATKLSKSGEGSLASKLPLALNLTYTSATQASYPSGQSHLSLVSVDVSGAQGPAGAYFTAVVLAANASSNSSSVNQVRLGAIYINEHLSKTNGDVSPCQPYMDPAHKAEGIGCLPARFKFADVTSPRALVQAAVNSNTSEVDGLISPLPAGNLTRCAEAGLEATPMPPAGSKNVLYIVMDDLRPEIHEPYNQSKMFTPNIDKLAANATTFSNAYTNVAVCSPSRVSFLSGRRPTTTHVYNFINHFRQAHCSLSQSGVRWTGAPYRNLTMQKNEGGAGECCSQCTDDPECYAWSYEAPDLLRIGLDDTGRETVLEPEVRVGGTALGGDFFHDYCALYGAGYGKEREPASLQTVSGEKGAYQKLTSLPEHFQKSGYFTLQSGKIFHTEEGSLSGEGMPPYQDIAHQSWTDGCAMAAVNTIANMWGCDKTPNTQGCPIGADAEGIVHDGTAPLCDQVVAADAVTKLQLAAGILNHTGRPFFHAVGFRKPHMPWRFPKPYLDYYDSPEKIAVALHPMLHNSMPRIAHHGPDISENLGTGQKPWVPMNTSLAQLNRLYYYASVSWVDSRVGVVLNELDTLGLTPTTLVVFHADHGWALGEHGQWQKFNNWEVGTRVPLIIRAPWIEGASSMRTKALAELVDVYPTIADLAGVALPTGDDLPLDGVSLGPVLKSGGTVLGRAAALSVFGRCPRTADNTAFLTNPDDMWQNNWCEFIDRSTIPWMGFSMRTADWRYTEWAEWNGTALRPNWEKNAGVELYDHRGDDQTSFDAYENFNVATDNPDVVKTLSQQLHNLVKWYDVDATPLVEGGIEVLSFDAAPTSKA